MALWRSSRWLAGQVHAAAASCSLHDGRAPRFSTGRDGSGLRPTQRDPCAQLHDGQRRTEASCRPISCVFDKVQGLGVLLNPVCSRYNGVRGASGSGAEHAAMATFQAAIVARISFLIFSTQCPEAHGAPSGWRLATADQLLLDHGRGESSQC
jgi:hypothetical protein